MKHVVLTGVIFFGCHLSLLEAGSLVPLADSPELTGKLTLSPTSIHVEGSAPTDVNLPDVLEADLSETPFDLKYFFSTKDAPLPPGWAAGDIGGLSPPGSATNAGSAVTLKHLPVSQKEKGGRLTDNLFFAGCPWTGNMQWTVHLAKFNPDYQNALAGIMLRDSLDPGSLLFEEGTTPLGNGFFGFRNEAAKYRQAQQVSIDAPAWLRLTRYGLSLFASVSTDGKQWDLVGQNTFTALDNPLIGIFAESRSEKEPSEVTFDQFSITPVTSLGQVLPPGVILQSGSFLAGFFNRLEFDATNPELVGQFNCGGTAVSIPRSKIASVLLLPITRDQLADMNSHVGMLMKNGDIQDGDFDVIGGSTVEVNSVLLGPTQYNHSEVRGCFLKPMQTPSAPYQFRLRSGSIINASSFTVNGGEVVIMDASGVSITTTPADIAQFRAGPAQVQPLTELTWKATPPPAAAPAAAPAPPAANPAPAANAPSDDGQPLVQSWTGPNQEQILMTSMGTDIEFPLTGKFRAMGVKIALSPDSPPNSQITIRVLADGREIGHSPPFKAGDQPRFMELTLQDPKTVTLEADSIFTGTKVIFIDPVAIRDN
jgi:hypothetical protein